IMYYQYVSMKIAYYARREYCRPDVSFILTCMILASVRATPDFVVDQRRRSDHVCPTSLPSTRDNRRKAVRTPEIDRHIGVTPRERPESTLPRPLERGPFDP